jgi:hypothetical protein
MNTMTPSNAMGDLASRITSNSGRKPLNDDEILDRLKTVKLCQRSTCSSCCESVRVPGLDPGIRTIALCIILERYVAAELMIALMPLFLSIFS